MGTTVESLSTEAAEDHLPALLVTFGSTSNRRRPLTRHATLIGRNRCCDIRVDSPEVSGLHCLISRHVGGLTLRDCDSRGGVIVNGHPVREAELCNGDRVQVGPFTFEVSIPVVPVTPSVITAPAPQAKDESETLRQSLAEKDEQARCLQQHIASVEGERDRLAAQIHQLRDEIDELQEARADNEAEEVESLRREREEQQASADRVKQEIEESRRREESLLAERDELRREIESIREASVKVDREAFDRAEWLEQEIESITADRNRLRADCEALQHSAESHEREIQRIREQFTGTDSERAALLTERDQLRHALVEYSRQAATELREEVLQYAGEIDRLKERLAASQAQIEQSTRTIGAHEQTIADLEARLAADQAQEEENKQTVSELKQTIAELETRLIESQSQADESTQAIGDLESTITKLKASLVAAEEKNRELQSAVAAQGNTAEESAAELQSLRAREEEWAQERALLATELETLSRERDEAQSAIQSSQADASRVEELETHLASLRSQLEVIAADRDRVQEELSAMANEGKRVATAEITELEAELAGLVQKLHEADAERADYQRRLEAEHEQSEHRLALLKGQLETERQQMKQLVMQAAADHDRTRAEMEDLRHKLSDSRQLADEDFPPDEWRAEAERLALRVRELEAGYAGPTGSVSGEEGEGVTPELQSYESQLNQYREDLERAQDELNQREAELGIERDALQDKLRQAELDLSRERAALARDRAEMERVRREFIAEMEHAERESQVRAKLAPLEQLAQEVKGRAQESAPATSSLTGRLRNLLKRVGGGDRPANDV